VAVIQDGTRANTSIRPNWRFLLGQFFTIVVGVLVALWADQVRAARAEAALEVEYLESIVIDLEADLAQFDTADAWSRRQEAAAATVLALYNGLQPTKGVADLVAAVESAGWQYVPSITRNTIDDLRSTGNLRLLRDPTVRRAISSYYTTVEAVSVPNAAMRDRMWNEYDARVGQVLEPGLRLRVLQGEESFGQGITSDVLAPAEVPVLDDLIAALRAVPKLKVAAGEVLYQSLTNRAGVASLRTAAMELRDVLLEHLGATRSARSRTGSRWPNWVACSGRSPALSDRRGAIRDIRTNIRDIEANAPGVRPGRFPRQPGRASAEPNESCQWSPDKTTGSTFLFCLAAAL
jgi:hypothetical protein